MINASKRFFSFVSVLLILFSYNAFAQEVAGVKLTESVVIDEQSLLLNGAGVRSKFFMDLYVGALYLPKKSENAKSIVNGDSAMMIQLNITSDMITSDRMIDAIEEGFDSATDGNLTQIRAQIDAFISVFNEKIEVGDVFTIYYVGNNKLTVKKNNMVLADINTTLAFKQALWGIWLSENPAQKSLKKAMLGQ